MRSNVEENTGGSDYMSELRGGMFAGACVL